MYQRLQNFADLGQNSCFLWGPRQSGKSTLLKNLFPTAPYYDLLLSEEFERLTRNASLMRQELLAQSVSGPIIIDEVQKIPKLLDEVQWLMVNHHMQFILSGSSARKLRRGGGNLLGGRAVRYELHPLVSAEISDFDLLQALNHGLLPRHYSVTESKRLRSAYVGDYLKEEIVAEALTRNIPAFAKFLEAAAFSQAEIVNYTNIAQECGISVTTVRDYFQILVDTLIGYFLPAYRKKAKRRVIQAPKFYFFDVGIANTLLKRDHIEFGSESFGRAFEHFIFQELIAHRDYSSYEYAISYWRTASGFEVDFILGEGDIALEVKGVPEVQTRHLKGLRAFSQDHTAKKLVIVSLDHKPRIIDGIHILPWQEFLRLLWQGELFVNS
ncbi:MAG TPA: DUF4143 domain-containing protein, partial [Patescibacteria group bacterium]|nr:DUF4143 domain-containing protein [Patescibacteria group bacterium]